MKYQVVYTKNKKGRQSKQMATFYKIEDANFWEKYVKEQGCIDTQIIPIFS